MTRPESARERGAQPQPTTIETSAGGVVIRMIEGVRHVLIILDPYKKWGLPKGHVEGEETPEQAAVREVTEETGLTDLRPSEELVTIDWHFRARGRKVHKYTTFFLMYSDTGEPVPETGEGITECEWVPLHLAHQRISYENASEVVQIAHQLLLEETSDEAAD
ncbi:MAG: NUDIX hydrolase [Longimicrobiales bacterium]